MSARLAELEPVDVTVAVRATARVATPDTEWLPEAEENNAARGLVLALLLALPFWAVAGLTAYWLF